MQVLNHLLYLMRVGEKVVQRRVALALAHLCSPDDQRTIFIDNNGMSYSLFSPVNSSLLETIFIIFVYLCWF